jgi:hypothetical protein
MSEYIYIPVPTEKAPAVYHLLAGGYTTSPGTPSTDADIPNPAATPDEELVHRMYIESYDGHKRLMRLLAKTPERWLYTAEIATELDIEHGARGVAGMLGAFGRRSKNRYGHLKPWVTQWDGIREEARHMMTSDIAKIITSLQPEA